MARRPGAYSGNARVRALMRAQEMNDILKRGIVQSEALQSSGDDRPWGEDHISELLSEDASGRRSYRIAGAGPGGRGARPKRSSSRKGKRR
ncbi:MAG: hypothetical protein M1321_00175 [Candidatus Marsarchaeota archaeon]|nr:hypothetical protein [Candidatus Marsarchaeota archaeon]